MFSRKKLYFLFHVFCLMFVSYLRFFYYPNCYTTLTLIWIVTCRYSLLYVAAFITPFQFLFFVALPKEKVLSERCWPRSMLKRSILSEGTGQLLCNAMGCIVAACVGTCIGYPISLACLLPRVIVYIYIYICI